MKAYIHLWFFLLWRCDPTRVMASSFLRFLDHTQRRTTVGRIPLDEWSARRRDLYLTTHNTQNRQISMTPVGFEPTISAGERPQTYALDRAATGTGTFMIISGWIFLNIRSVSDKFVSKMKAHILCSINVLFWKIVPLMRWCGKIWYSQAGHRW